MRYISLFAGIGGFDLALNRLGHTCVWANEWNKYAAQIYNKNFEEAQSGGNSGSWADSPNTDGEPRTYRGSKSTHGIDTRDITTVPTSEIPDHDLLVGGFPCQAFSIAGKRRGFDDTRGTLFFEIARILKDKQPKLFILENVKGLLSHDGGNTFKTIISTLTELGYDLQWQVLNSKNFGVPQNRERVFIVGHIRGERRPEVFPIGEDDHGNTEKQLQGKEASKSYGTGFNLENWRGHSLPKVRSLTPTECERLQGFPDGWTEYGLVYDCDHKFMPAVQQEWYWKKVIISDTQRYKCLGNAVTVNVVEEIAKRLGNLNPKEGE